MAHSKKDKADAYMPLWIGDYQADTAHLDAAQHGAYLLLLMAYWRSGPLPVDDKRLASIGRMTLPQWKKNRDTIMEFFQERDGKLYQKRIDRELNDANERRTAAKKAADTRWERERNKCETDADASKPHGVPHCPSPPASTPPPTGGGESPPPPLQLFEAGPWQGDPKTDPRFVAFSEAYGKHVKTKSAAAAFAVALTVDSADRIIAGAWAWNRAHPTIQDRQYLPNPDGWLENERWKEPPPVRRQAETKGQMQQNHILGILNAVAERSEHERTSAIAG